MSEAAAKRDIQKLQRAIVDGLEDVKAQDIRVFNTEHLSPLFERVIVASGTSNRQTQALAASVRDKVREAGFAKPRLEGEENGEWIIVDCGAAVAHVMQPVIRQYYNLEEIWGDKPVRVRLAGPAARAAGTARKRASQPGPADSAPDRREASPAKVAAKAPAARKAAAGKTPTKPGARRAAASPPARGPGGATSARGSRPAGKPGGTRAPSSASGTRPAARSGGRTRTAPRVVVVNKPGSGRKSASTQAKATPRKSATRAPR